MTELLSTRSSIFTILRWGNPSAILNRITFVIIDAVNTHARWALAHIGKEIFKYEPAIADCDTSATPVRKTCGFGIDAASDHSRPRFIHFRSGSTVSASAIAKLFAVKATTRLRQTMSNAISGNGFRPTAITAEQPLRPAEVILCNKSTKSLICYV